MNRRTFLHHTGVMASTLYAPSLTQAGRDEYPPIRRVTDGRHFCWFGYYDKWQIDPTGRYALGGRPTFEGRSPTDADHLTLGLIDLKTKAWRTIGTSQAWGWQQGCMLQWIPGSAEEVIWNDRANPGRMGERYVARVYNIRTGQTRTLPRPIYALASNGRFAIGTEFNRIQNLRPGYGYAGIPDPYAAVKAPTEIGLYRMDLQTGDSQLLVSLADMAALSHQGDSVADNWHWFNHLLVNPDSSRLLFLHRWRKVLEDRQTMARTNFVTRMVTLNTDGSDRYIVDPSGYSSHFVWRDPKHIFVYTKPNGDESGFYLLTDHTQQRERMGREAMTGNGHNTYVPNTNHEWVLNDTYPSAERLQTPYLYHLPSGRKVILGQFLAPEAYTGEWRCDLHPRCNQQGTKVYIDSAHEGLGRQMYEIDIERIVR